ncbi:glycerate kinase [Psychroserpens damuponensis]|uniref:glycerate kinase n=1 Tax=Psychroserpens damuponensis TaxID=943936 RepID=UPI00058E3DB6|nr:glycerate kinase [Psychroserpens damuponensis]
MKIVLAPDKFKNSLTGMEFCDAVEEGFKAEHRNVDMVKLPLADGGDGTIEVVNYYLQGNVIKIEVNNPFFKPVVASYLYSEISKIAFIEMAEASGVKLLQKAQFDCVHATTLGTGEMIVDALNKGAKTIILGIGGSATNDCGIGMATALGYKFLDDEGHEVKPIGRNLSIITTIDDSKVNQKLKGVSFNIACDVSNPLYGSEGAAYVYAQQKGASIEDIAFLDQGLKDFSKVLSKKFSIDPQTIKGAGAAGGMGIASKLFLSGLLKPGIELIKSLANFDSKIENADWIITGEGSLDEQTFSGKTINGVLTSAKEKQIKVAALCGTSELSNKSAKASGIDYVDTVMNYSKGMDDAMKNSTYYVKMMAKKFAKEL